MVSIKSMPTHFCKCSMTLSFWSGKSVERVEGWPKSVGSRSAFPDQESLSCREWGGWGEWEDSTVCPKVGWKVRPLSPPHPHIHTHHYLSLGTKITADGDCSHEIKRCLLLGRKVMSNLDRTLKCWGSSDETTDQSMRFVIPLFVNFTVREAPWR